VALPWLAAKLTEMGKATQSPPAPAPRSSAFTWGQFKAQVDDQLADLLGDEESLKFISWDGNEKPVVRFDQDRRGHPWCGVV
jgi:hypothetical protein